MPLALASITGSAATRSRRRSIDLVSIKPEIVELIKYLFSLSLGIFDCQSVNSQMGCKVCGLLGDFDCLSGPAFGAVSYLASCCNITSNCSGNHLPGDLVGVTSTGGPSADHAFQLPPICIAEVYRRRAACRVAALPWLEPVGVARLESATRVTITTVLQW
jgi:hypothetical protein